jgi:hypothetical protein
MRLAEAVERLRRPILENQPPDREMLKVFAEMVELSHLEWSKAPDNDRANQNWADYLAKKAKSQGWFTQCVRAGILAKNWLTWPNHKVVWPEKLYKPEHGTGRSIHSVPGGAVEQNRRKH